MRKNSLISSGNELSPLHPSKRYSNFSDHSEQRKSKNSSSMLSKKINISSLLLNKSSGENQVVYQIVADPKKHENPKELSQATKSACVMPKSDVTTSIFNSVHEPPPKMSKSDLKKLIDCSKELQ